MGHTMHGWNNNSKAKHNKFSKTQICQFVICIPVLTTRTTWYLNSFLKHDNNVVEMIYHVVGTMQEFRWNTLHMKYFYNSFYGLCAPVQLCWIHTRFFILIYLIYLYFIYFVSQNQKDIFKMFDVEMRNGERRNRNSYLSTIPWSSARNILSKLQAIFPVEEKETLIAHEKLVDGY